MSRRIHMQDQVGTDKINEIMSHYERCTLDMWAMKFLVIGVLLLMVFAS